MALHRTPRPIPPEEQSTKTLVRDAAADAAGAAVDGALERLTPLLGRNAVRPADSYGKDKRAIVAWAAAVIGGAILSWGIWITVEVFAVRSDNRIEEEQIRSNENASRERDKALAESAAERAAAIQVQLAQIQAQLSEIQRELRRGNHP